MSKDDSSFSDTQTATELRHLGVMVEHIIDQQQATLEVISEMQKQTKHIPAIREDIAELKVDMKTVRAAVTDTNKDLHGLERLVLKSKAV